MTLGLRGQLSTPFRHRYGVCVDAGLLCMPGRVHARIACVQFTTNKAQQNPLERVVEPPISDRVNDGI